MKLYYPFTALFLITLAAAASVRTEEVKSITPNVLFIIADDASHSFGETYGCTYAKTPNIDRIAKQGLVFDNAYTPTSKCGPSRAAILTGRNPWQLEEAANHQPIFPIKFLTFTEVLAKAGIACSNEGKTWGPGSAKTSDGNNRIFGLTDIPRSGSTNPNPGKGFSDFLKKRPSGTPFFYWFGSHYPHRPYKQNSGIAAGKKITDIDRVPSYLPDNEIVRRDLLDYAVSIEAFDAQIGSLLAALDASGEANNTLVIITSDNGMPFPRVKGHTYDDAHRMPLILWWPDGLAKPGRRTSELISFIDLAPTILSLFKVDGPQQGMSPITGHSFMNLLQAKPQENRDFLLIGRERNDVLGRPGSPAGLGYPARGIREGNLLYIHNYETNRWPCGDPDRGLKDSDKSPTKSFITDLAEGNDFWKYAFGKRPADELYDLGNDPDCMKNLASSPEYADKLKALSEKMAAELIQQKDPRALGHGEVFDNYPSAKTKGE